MKLSLNWDKLFTHLKPLTGNFWDIAHPYKLLASKCIRYDDMISLLYFYIYLLFALAYLCIAWQIPPLILFPTIRSISIFVNKSNSTFFFFNYACHANPGADKKGAGSSSYISVYLSLKFSKTLASNNVSDRTYKSWYSPRLFISNDCHNFLTCP